jgi:hypothetical protein
MLHGRIGHTCAAVCLDPFERVGIIATVMNPEFIMSVVVLGGE